VDTEFNQLVKLGQVKHMVNLIDDRTFAPLDGYPSYKDFYQGGEPGLRVSAVGIVEAVQRSERASRGDLEDRAPSVGPAEQGCPIEDPVLVLD
jgi:hypothetical protein